jgi:hypothetical protein
MNHDELIFEINHDIENANGLSEPGLKALLAVVKLHNPIRTPDGCGDQCSECKTDYPCPTIQAIEKELS